MKRIWLMGGGKLATTFRLEGLIAQYLISVIPVLLGGGIPLFAHAPQLDSLRLTGTRSYQSGIVQLSYEPVAEAPNRDT